MDCTQAVPGRSAGSASRRTSSAAAPSYSMVRTTSASRTASAGVSATWAPSAARGSALARVRFQARTVCPARARLRAIAAPMIPVPRTLTVSLSVMTSTSSCGGACIAAWPPPTMPSRGCSGRGGRRGCTRPGDLPSLRRPAPRTEVSERRDLRAQDSERRDSAAARSAAAERTAASLVPAGPVLGRAGPGPCVAGQLVRGQPFLASGDLVGLPVFADLTDRATVRQPWLFIRAWRARFASHHADTQPERADQQRRDHHAYHHDRGTAGARARGRLHPCSSHGTRVPVTTALNQPVRRRPEPLRTPGLAPSAPATRTT